MRRATQNFPAALCALIAVLGVFAPRAGARAESEIAPPDKRHLSVEKAVQLARQTKAAPLPATLSLPFAPPQFDLTDAEEAAAAAAAARAANQGVAGAPPPPSDHELLQEIASKVKPGGTINFPSS